MKNALLALAAATLLIMGFKWQVVFAWANQNDGLAAWAQAVGTVAALVGAVWIGGAPIREERKRTEARGRVIAFRLSPDMISLVSEVSQARPALAVLRQEPQSASVATIVAPVASLRFSHGIQPDVFGESWTLPPHIALAVAQLDNCLSNHAGLLTNAESVFLMPDRDFQADFLNRAEISINAIERLALEIRDYSSNIAEEVALKQRAADA
jgi:hypothetical protein